MESGFFYSTSIHFMKNQLLLLLVIFAITACQQPATHQQVNTETEELAANPAAPDFNAAGSDERAIAIADEVMKAMGGRAAWDQAQYIQWNFFGRRMLLWDKHNQRVRIDLVGDSTVYLIDLKSNSGQVLKDGEALAQPDSLAKYVKQGESIWINDSYWLVMPYKLKDSGVTLKYVGQDTTQAGKLADVLQLIFERVGDTPENKYWVYVDPETKLVTQWDFFTNADDEAPRFSTPWEGYEDYHGILLSGGRGKNQLSEIAVYEQVPNAVFEDFTEPKPEAFK